MILTLDLCYASGRDAGNRSMRKAGRAAWSETDYDVAAETTVRLSILGGFAPVQAYRDCCGEEFPYTLAANGAWVSADAR
jgi:hypothetical protein